jgi:hypothetical protein
MSMRRPPLPASMAALLLPLLLCCAGAQAQLETGAAQAVSAAAPAIAPVQQEELYLEALRALADDQPERANALLLRFLEHEPRHAGAWLDLAFSQCALGHAAEAERLFREIEARFKPPPAIMELIQQHRARGCNTRPTWKALWAASLGRGYDNNINQGASNSLFSSGSGSDLIQWELAPDYLPKPDHLTLAGLDYLQQVDEAGSLLIAQLRVRQNDHVHQQDSVSLLLGYERPWRWGSWQGYATAAASALVLERQLYQRQGQLQLRATPPLALPEHLQWSLLASVSHLRYPTRTKYDSNTLEVGSSLYWRADRQLSLSVSALTDQGQDGRLGGNRTGWYGALQWTEPLPATLQGELGFTRQVWNSSAVYSAGLIDTVRRQDTRQLRAALRLPLGARHNLQLEWRQVHNRENISLLQYNSQAIQLSWHWTGF